MGTTVVIAEDAFIVREGIRLLLEGAGYDLRAAVESYDELMAAVEEHSPDVVITDIRMPPTRTDEGVRAAREIRERHPATGVVVLSQYVEPEYAIKLFEAGHVGDLPAVGDRTEPVGVELIEEAGAEPGDAGEDVQEDGELVHAGKGTGPAWRGEG